MPIYEYQCGACGHRFETLQKVSESPLMECPDCGQQALKKLISATAFRLKGGGWYETDFKTGTKKNVAGGDKPGAAGKSSDGGKPSAAGKSSDGGKSTAAGGKSGSTSEKKK
jgi:putative FmdB family regulatory protein